MVKSSNNSRCPQRTETSSRSCNKSNKNNNINRLVYRSPRVDNPDEELLPPKSESDLLQTTAFRWDTISKQAGEHKQDGSILILTNRQYITPVSLKSGVPPNAASRVRVLHLPATYEKIDSRLPEWLDVISNHFLYVQHLYTSSSSESPTSNQQAEDQKMKRLYIIYRLPYLLSIDGKVVTAEERELARPSSPNGHRVQKKKGAVVEANDNSNDTDSRTCDNSSSPGRAIEVSLSRCMTRVDIDDSSVQKRDKEDATTNTNTSDGRNEQHQCNTDEKCEEESTTTNATSMTSKLSVNTSCNSLLRRTSDTIAKACSVNPCIGSSVSNVVDDETDSLPYAYAAQNTQHVNPEYQRSLTKDTTKPAAAIITGATSSNIKPRNYNNNQMQSKDHKIGNIPCGSQATQSTAVRRPPPISTSLSSPFPMQFRRNSNAASEEKQTQVVGTEESECIKSSESISPPLQLGPCHVCDESIFEGDQSSLAVSTSQEVNMQSTSSSRPPKCPGSSRRLVPITPSQKTKSRKGKRAGWRKTAVTKSIVDNDDEDDDENDSDDENHST